MALHVTQCPRCESTFNTSARMLEAAHGLVRCGACLSIFEADQHFVNPLPAASNDEHGDPAGESVFISAPEEYFDPAEFLHDDDQTEDNVFEDKAEDEPLYAKTDIHDSSFDVFDGDTAPADSKVHEQILDSDFDVFDVSNLEQGEEQAKAETQDNEFDIYDAGERVITAKPESRQHTETAKLNPGGDRPSNTSNEPFQLKATFSFSPGMPQAIFIPQPDAEISEPDLQEPMATVDITEVDLPEAADEAEKTLPPELLDDSFVILPEGPDAATLLKALNADEDSEVILPSGSDAETLLRELKDLHEQAVSDEDWEEPEQSDTETAREEPTFLPDEQMLDESDVVDSQQQDFDNAADDFSDALADGLEWEEADLEIDESSFVILPVDPYQPSAFQELAEKQAEQSFDEAEALDDIDIEDDIAELNKTEDLVAREEPAVPVEAAEPAEKETAIEQPFEEPIPTLETDESSEVPTLTDFVSESDQSLTEDYEDVEAEGDGKDVIRSRVMATESDEQDESLEQLSEENLRAVRDVDTALELEQHKKAGASRSGLVVGGGLLLVLISSLVFFWLKMPEFSQDPRLRTWYQTACNLVGCSLPTYVNPGQVETSNLVVRSHPQRENTLELTAVFRNAAQFPQPFPLIELTFSDLNNRPMMVFEFLPGEYLPQALRGMPLMPVGAPVQITLDLADPGSDAVNYQMSYRAAPPRPR